MTKCYDGDIIGFRVGGLLLCRSCFENKGLKSFDSVIREDDPDIFDYDCKCCHICLFVWRSSQDLIKEHEGWRRIKLRGRIAPLSMLATGGVQTGKVDEEQVHLRERVLTRLIMAAAHKKWIKRTSNSSAAKITVLNSHDVASINDDEG